MKDIYIIRHGQTEYNKKMIIQGSGIDSDLNEKGRAQAQLFYEKYKSVDFELVITSKLKRSQQTVEGFINKGIPHIKYANINEIGWGVHEGVGGDGDPKLRETYQWLIGEWGNGNLDARVEGGESAFELMNRCKLFIDDLKTIESKKILVCTHGRTLRCLIALLKNESMKAMEQYQHANTGLYRVQYLDQQFQVILENDTSHFPPRELS